MCLFEAKEMLACNLGRYRLPLVQRVKILTITKYLGKLGTVPNEFHCGYLGG